MLTPYPRIRALAERVELVRLPNDEISDEIPRFASLQSNFIADKGVSNPWFIRPCYQWTKCTKGTFFIQYELFLKSDAYRFRCQQYVFKMTTSNTIVLLFYRQSRVEQNKTKQSRTEWNGTERNGTGQGGAERSRTEQSRTEQNKTERSGAEQNRIG